MYKKSKKIVVGVFGIALICASQLAAGEKRIHDQVNDMIFSGKFKEAEEKAKKYIELHPDDPEGICALACVYRNSALKSGVVMQKSALGMKEGDSSGVYKFENEEEFKKIFQEKQYYEPEEYKKAEQLYYQLIERFPEYHNAYFNLLNDYVVMEDFEKYFKVIDLFISNLKDDEDTKEHLLDLGVKLYEKQYYEEVLKLYTIGLHYYPDNHLMRSDMGAVYVNMGKIEEANQIFAEMSAKIPDDVINLSNYYLTLILTEDYQKAYNVKKKLLEVDDQQTFHLYDLIFLSFALKKDHKKFAKEFLLKREKDEKEDDFWYQTARDLSRMENDGSKRSIDTFEGLLHQFNKYEYTALAIITAVILEKNGENSFALVVHTSILDKYNYHEKTIEYLNKIEKRKEKDSDIMSQEALDYNFGINYYSAKDFKKAKFYLLKYFEVNAKNATVNYYLARCHEQLGEKSEAEKLYLLNSKMDDKDQMEFINYSIRELERMKQESGEGSKK